MRKICLNCHKIGKAQHKYNFFYGNIYLGIVQILLGINFLLNRELFNSKALNICAGLFLIVFGVLSMIEYIQGGKICSECKKESMIPLNNPEAQKIIQENNITVPQETQS